MSVGIESATIYKSTSITPFHYVPQTNLALIKAATNKLEEERNKINWRMTNSTKKKQGLSHTQGIGRITNMEDVAMTCSNICGVILVIVDVPATKPILYQFAWKLIKLIKNKKNKAWMHKNKHALEHLPMVFMGKISQVFQHIASFSQS